LDTSFHYLLLLFNLSAYNTQLKFNIDSHFLTTTIVEEEEEEEDYIVREPKEKTSGLSKN